MQTLRRPKVRDQVDGQIQQYIVKQKLGPGDRLPTETQPNCEHTSRATRERM